MKTAAGTGMNWKIGKLCYKHFSHKSDKNAPVIKQITTARKLWTKGLRAVTLSLRTAEEGPIPGLMWDRLAPTRILEGAALLFRRTANL